MRISACNSTFASIVIFSTLQLVIVLFYLKGNAWRRDAVSDRSILLVRSRNFEILPHPLKINDALEFVKKLRDGKQVAVSPINLDYMLINYSSHSMRECDLKETVDILIMIKSSPSHWEDRMQFRNTWANPNYLSQFEIKIKYAFVIGKSDVIRAKNDHNLRSEIELYHDFVVGDFLDTYRNLTYKTMFGIRWAVEHCPNFKFYVSFDDDSYISIANLIKFFGDPYNYPNVLSKDGFRKILQSSDDFYSGHTYRNGLAHPSRNKENKFYMSIQEYPLKIFPSYIAGYFVAMSRETVQNFYFLSPFVLHVPMEDVYLGLMANKLKLVPLDMTEFVTDRVLIKLKPASVLKDFIVIHHVQPPKQRTRIWRLLNLNGTQWN